MWRLHNLKRAILLEDSMVVKTASLSPPGRSYATHQSAKCWKSRKREIFSAEEGKRKEVRHEALHKTQKSRSGTGVVERPGSQCSLIFGSFGWSTFK
jgi:hypothetical protein